MDEQVPQIKKVRVADLMPHPKNMEIYGDEDVSDLVKNIRSYGLRMPITITDHNVIIAGHRRFKACKEIGFKKIDAIVKHYDSAEDEIEDLVNLNLARERTATQKAREAATLIEVEKAKAEFRRAAGLKQNQNTVVPNLAQRKDEGKSREAVAEKVGFKSGQEADRAMKTVKKIDELQSKGDKDSKEKAEILQGVLNNRNASAAEELSKHIDEVDVETGEFADAKEEIKAGKVAPQKILRPKPEPAAIIIGGPVPEDKVKWSMTAADPKRFVSDQQMRLQEIVGVAAAGVYYFTNEATLCFEMSDSYKSIIKEQSNTLIRHLETIFKYFDGEENEK